MRKGSLVGLSLFVWIIVSLVPGYAKGRIYTIDSKAEWDKWRIPGGVVKITSEGRVGLVKVRKSINTAANAHQFVHLSAKGEELRGGIRKAGSNPGDAAANILDEDPSTWWKPSQRDDLKSWWVRVDLGRVVSATKIRLIFPDVPDARPFEQFTVYVSPGVRPVPGADMFDFMVAGRTTRPNTSTVVEYDLRYERADTTTTGERVTYALGSLPVQYIEFDANSKTEDAALAELEVWALGDNIALGTIQRGGTWVPGRGTATPAIFDGDMSTYFDTAIGDELKWKSEGAYFVWDLGALFWVDQIQLLTPAYGWGGFGSAGSETTVPYCYGYIIRVSDGSRTPEGEIDYQTLVDVNNNLSPRRYFFNHTLSRQRVRYIFLRYAHKSAVGGRRATAIIEMQIYGEGYPAGATLESDLIDLGKLVGDNKPKNITAISWVGDIPPSTKIEIQTTSGDSLREEIHYYDMAGKEISKQQWDKLKKWNRQGKKEIIQKPGADWSLLSRVYQYPSGERFLSPSPRRYMKFQVKLLSDEPDMAPSLDSISIHYTDPLVEKVIGRISPSSVRADQDTLFTYFIVPTYVSGNIGFDQVLIKVPSPVESTTVALKVDGKDIEPISVETPGDSLLVRLPSLIRRQGVEVSFRSRVSRNSTTFEAFISNSKKPDIWQRVDSAKRGATIVSLPSVPGSKNLIGNLTIQPRIITPNDDNRNEEAIIRFSLLKVEKIPEVTIYDLRGEVIRQLKAKKASLEGQPAWEAIWYGLDLSGELVLPGCYICQVKVDAQAGNTTVSQTIGVVY